MPNSLDSAEGTCLDWFDGHILVDRAVLEAETYRWVRQEWKRQGVLEQCQSVTNEGPCPATRTCIPHPSQPDKVYVRLHDPHSHPAPKRVPLEVDEPTDFQFTAPISALVDPISPWIFSAQPFSRQPLQTTTGQARHSRKRELQRWECTYNAPEPGAEADGHTHASVWTLSPDKPSTSFIAGVSLGSHSRSPRSPRQSNIRTGRSNKAEDNIGGSRSGGYCGCFNDLDLVQCSACGAMRPDSLGHDLADHVSSLLQTRDLRQTSVSEIADLVVERRQRSNQRGCRSRPDLAEVKSAVGKWLVEAKPFLHLAPEGDWQLGKPGGKVQADGHPGIGTGDRSRYPWGVAVHSEDDFSSISGPEAASFDAAADLRPGLPISHLRSVLVRHLQQHAAEKPSPSSIMTASNNQLPHTTALCLSNTLAAARNTAHQPSLARPSSGTIAAAQQNEPQHTTMLASSNSTAAAPNTAQAHSAVVPPSSTLVAAHSTGRTDSGALPSSSRNLQIPNQTAAASLPSSINTIAVHNNAQQHVEALPSSSHHPSMRNQQHQIVATALPSSSNTVAVQQNMHQHEAMLPSSSHHPQIENQQQQRQQTTMAAGPLPTNSMAAAHNVEGWHQKTEPSIRGGDGDGDHSRLAEQRHEAAAAGAVEVVMRLAARTAIVQKRIQDKEASSRDAVARRKQIISTLDHTFARPWEISYSRQRELLSPSHVLATPKPAYYTDTDSERMIGRKRPRRARIPFHPSDIEPDLVGMHGSSCPASCAGTATRPRPVHGPLQPATWQSLHSYAAEGKGVQSCPGSTIQTSNQSSVLQTPHLPTFSSPCLAAQHYAWSYCASRHLNSSTQHTHPQSTSGVRSPMQNGPKDSSHRDALVLECNHVGATNMCRRYPQMATIDQMGAQTTIQGEQSLDQMGPHPQGQQDLQPVGVHLQDQQWPDKVGRHPQGQQSLHPEDAPSHSLREKKQKFHVRKDQECAEMTVLAEEGVVMGSADGNAIEHATHEQDSSLPEVQINPLVTGTYSQDTELVDFLQDLPESVARVFEGAAHLGLREDIIKRAASKYVQLQESLSIPKVAPFVDLFPQVKVWDRKRKK